MLGTVIGSVVGAIGANMLENKHKKHKEEKQYEQTQQQYGGAVGGLYPGATEVARRVASTPMDIITITIRDMALDRGVGGWMALTASKCGFGCEPRT